MNQDITRKNSEELQKIISSMDHEKIENIAKLIKSRIYDHGSKIKTGKKLILCGNGGSAAEADHMMGELIGRYKDDRTPFPCLNLAASGATSTCISNDYGQEVIFKRTLEALGEEGDILVALTTSGYSKNVNEAVKKAKDMGITVITLLGKDGGPLKGHGDYEIIIPSNSTARIQEAHLFILHCICDYLEKFSLENGN